jgi:hypothetical protein
MRPLGNVPPRLLFGAILLALGAGLLSSCATNEPPPLQNSEARTPARRAEAPPPPSSAAPRPARKPAVHAPDIAPGPAPDEIASASASTGPRPAQDAAHASSPPDDVTELSTSPGPPSPAPSRAELIGLDESAATRLFGAATEKSEQPPATVWHYKSANCELDLFFYLDLRSGRMRTLHYRLKGESAETSRRQDCLRSLVASRGR